jgi:hypothetical protein
VAETLQQYKERVARAGGNARADKLTAKERKQIAQDAARARWAKQKKEKPA